MLDKKINVCLACDDNYAKYAGVVIASILANANKSDKLSFYILDGGICDENRTKILSLENIKECQINFIKIDESVFEAYKKIKTHSYLTLPAFYRLKLASLLPQLNKIIYLDCDVIVNSSLNKLYNLNIDKYAIAAVKDINKRMLKKNPNYFNSGVLLINLKYWRNNNIECTLLNFTKENVDNIKTGDQEILNMVLFGNVKIIDDEWNVQSSNFTNRSSYTNKPKIIHFVAKNKPWKEKCFSYHKNFYFNYLQKTPWLLDNVELKEVLKSTSLQYIKYRPLFLFRPRFYKALFYTYIEPIFSYKKPVIKNNTFIVWEPCSQSHSEVVPGYVKYLLDLGYHVSVCVNPERYKEGLFSRFNNENVSLNKLSRKQVKEFFRKDNLEDVAGVLVTTVGKLCDEIHYEDCYKFFNQNVDKSKLFFVEHEAKHALDAGTWLESLITLRELNYKNGKSVVVNPHYFGDIKITPKNNITNFVMVGAIKPYKKNDNTIIEAVLELAKQGITNFKITVIGKGHIKNIPANIRKFFDMKGRLPFAKMYDEIEKADFLLTAYDEEKSSHIRYNTTGTSGNFQLVYGFLKPCIITKGFASLNGFDDENSILYTITSDYSEAMKKAIDLNPVRYAIMQNSLKKYADSLYQESLENLRKAINE